MAGKGKWAKRKLSMESANWIREKYLEGSSINLLCKQYDVQRNSIKAILKGITYNDCDEHKNLMEQKNSRVTSIF
jgi:hypothetical protein|tara:strand:+ start:760 stop:984 length:225 start_codon:yes stop_codon:yes gene_type:complete